MSRAETVISSWLFRVVDGIERIDFTVPVGVAITDRYRIERKLGSGGFGTVYEATDLVLSRRVGLKLIHPAHIDDTQDLNPYLRTFLREARVTSQLIHRNIVTVHDLGRIEHCLAAPLLNGAPFMVTELLEGMTLRDRIAEGWEVAGWLDVMLNISDALVHAHGHGVLHRDLKPENVMCARDGVKVLDFGIAESFERADRILLPSRVEVAPKEALLVDAGTPGYMAPEQVAGAPQDPRTDLYAFGVLMYETLAGQRPAVPPLPLRSHRADVSAGLADLIHRCLSPLPDDRPSSAGQVRELLQRHRRVVQPEEPVANDLDAAAPCPFPGLAPFGDEMVPYFFGRERESIECLDLVDASPRWLWIEARSGQGKSSFVRAGLLPQLRARWSWRSDEMPEHWLSRNELEGANLVIGDAGPAIFVIDQLEELGLGDEPARVRSAAAIRRILEERQSPTLLITTIRSDLVHEFLELLDVTAELNGHGRRYTLPQLAGDELRKAVEGPATLAGLHLESGLAESILSDCGAGQSTLPLVADVLRTLYEERDGRMLRLADYHAIGRVGGSVARWAEALVETIANHEDLRALLIAMICIRDGRPASRPITMAASIEAAGGGEVGRALLSVCLRSTVDTGAHRLLTAEGWHDHARVELVHEALITSWPRLRGWVANYADAIAARDELEASAQAWDAAGRLDDGLTRGDQLEYFRTATSASALAQSFLAHSALHQREAAARATKQRRVLRVASVAAVAMFAGTLGWTLNERRQADALRSESVEIAKRATTIVNRKKIAGTLADRKELQDQVAQVLDRSAEQGVPPSLFDRIRLAELRIRDHLQGDDFDAVAPVVDETLEALEATLEETPNDLAVLKRAGEFTYQAYWSLVEIEGPPKGLAVVGRGIRWLDRYLELAPEDAEVFALRAHLWVVVSNQDAFELIGPDGGAMLVGAGSEVIGRAGRDGCGLDTCADRLQLGFSVRAHGHEINGALADAVADFSVVAGVQLAELNRHEGPEAKRHLAAIDRRMAQLAARNGDHARAKLHMERSLLMTFDVAAENRSEERWYRISPARALWIGGFTEALAGHTDESRRFFGRARSWAHRHAGTSANETDLLRGVRHIVALADLAYRDADHVALGILTQAVLDHWWGYQAGGWYDAEMEAAVIRTAVRSERLAGRLVGAEALIDAYLPVVAAHAKSAGVYRLALRHLRLLVEQAAVKCALGKTAEGQRAQLAIWAILDELADGRSDLIVDQARLDANALCL